jgi:hypothetical protein
MILLIVLLGGGALVFGYPDRQTEYAPAESLAGPMTPEWRDFADEVDHVCARNLNATQSDVDGVRDQSDDEGWSGATTSSAEWHVQAVHQAETQREVLALGRPPAQPELFQEWATSVGRRAQLMEDVSQAWGREDRNVAEVGRLRLEGMKIDANWVGQHFGLRICTSNGPAPEPGEPPESYLTQVNRVCVDRNAREDAVGAKQLMTPPKLLSISKGETLGIAAIEPTTDEYPVRRRILAIKKSLDRYFQALLLQAAKSPDPGRTWEHLADLESRHADRASLQLQALGLQDCSNWGPTPAPSLLPR